MKPLLIIYFSGVGNTKTVAENMKNSVTPNSSSVAEDIDEETVADLLSEMRDALQRNAKRPVIRLEIASNMSAASRKWLYGKLELPEDHIYSIKGLMNLKSCFEITSLNRPELLPPQMEPLASTAVKPTETVFESIRRNGSFLLHHPYESFAPVIRFLNEAADDPDVLAIKQTLYRVSGDSPIVKALMRAARNGKQVTVGFCPEVWANWE